MSLRRRLLALSPILIIGALIAWSAAVSPFTYFGEDDWKTWPLTAGPPLFVLWNIGLVFILWDKKLNIYYALANVGYVLMCIAIFFFVWFYCAMLVTKDSL